MFCWGEPPGGHEIWFDYTYTHKDIIFLPPELDISLDGNDCQYPFQMCGKPDWYVQENECQYYLTSSFEQCPSEEVFWENVQAYLNAPNVTVCEDSTAYKTLKALKQKGMVTET